MEFEASSCESDLLRILYFSATGKVLATELPRIGNKTTILYPASAKASNEIGMRNVCCFYKISIHML